MAAAPVLSHATHLPSTKAASPQPLPMQQAEGVLGELALAERAYMEADMEMRQHMVWFWRW